MKLTLIFTALLVCSPKLSILTFEEQLEYSGVQNGKTYVNYTIKIANPKNSTIEIESIWVKGKKIRFTQSEFSGNPISVNISDVWQNPNVPTTPSPSKKASHLGVIKFHVKGKRRPRYIGIEKITEKEPLPRP